MATVTVSYGPAAGRQFVELTSWAGSASFATTPVSGNQIEGDAALTIGADGVVTGPDGSYTLYLIKNDGGVEAASFQIGAASESATTTVPYLPPAGLEYVTLEAPIEHWLDQNWDAPAEAGEQVIFDPNEVVIDKHLNWSSPGETGPSGFTLWYINNAGKPFEVVFTAEDIPVIQGSAPTQTAPLPNVTGVAGATENIALGDYFSGATSYTVTGIPAGSGLTHAGSTISGTYNATDVANSPYTLTVTATNNDGSTAPDTFDVTASAAPSVVPQGTWVIGTVTTDHESVSLTPVYSDSDATSYEYTLNGTTWTPFSGTISESGLSPGTSYMDAAVRAVNSVGPGASESFTFTTDVAPVVPVEPKNLTVTQLSSTSVRLAWERG